MNDLYSRIEQLCKIHGISVNAMCKNAGVGQGTISDLKSGRSKSLSTPTAEKIAKYFDISPSELLYGESPASDAPGGEVQELNELLEALKERSDLRILFRLSKNATVEDVQKAIKIIEALKGE